MKEALYTKLYTEFYVFCPGTYAGFLVIILVLNYLQASGSYFQNFSGERVFTGEVGGAVNYVGDGGAVNYVGEVGGDFVGNLVR